MDWFNTTATGYRHNKAIYLSYFFGIVVIVIYVMYLNHFDFSAHPYLACESPTCQNPFYGQPCSMQLNIIFFIPLYATKDCRQNPENKWLDLKTVPRGVYGSKQSFNSDLIYIGALIGLITSLLLNHYLYNRGKKFDIEIPFSKKHKFSIRQYMERVENEGLAHNGNSIDGQRKESIEAAPGGEPENNEQRKGHRTTADKEPQNRAKSDM